MLSRQKGKPQPTLLERYWTALRASGATPPEGLDAELAALARRLSEDIARLDPPRAVVAEIREQLMPAAPPNGHHPRAWSGPAVDFAQKRRTAHAIKDAVEREIVSATPLPRTIPTPFRRPGIAREALKLVAAVLVFAAIGALFTIMLRVSHHADHRPADLAIGLAATPAASAPSMDTSALGVTALSIAVDGQPRFVTFGAGSLWVSATADDGSGVVVRIDRRRTRLSLPSQLVEGKSKPVMTRFGPDRLTSATSTASIRRRTG